MRRLLLTLMLSAVLCVCSVEAGHAANRLSSQVSLPARERLIALLLPGSLAPQDISVVALAWSPLDGATAASLDTDGLAVLLYRRTTTAGDAPLERLAAPARWDGIDWHVMLSGNSGIELSGDAARLALPGWSVALTLESARGGPVAYAARYRGLGPLPGGADGTITVTELFDSAGNRLWERVTELSEVEPGGTSARRTVQVQYDVTTNPPVPPRIVASVAEASATEPGNSTLIGLARLQLFEEIYEFDGASFTLRSRTIKTFP